MRSSVENNLKGMNGNYLLPFFWQHGEDEAVLREYMGVIEASGIKAVCVESRPHPDFCGPKWWHDMDVILDEARKRGMKVWILDDSHFPTGFANGAMEGKPDSLRRKGICYQSETVNGSGKTQAISVDKFLKKSNRKASLMNAMASASNKGQTYPDDEFLAAVAYPADGRSEAPVSLTQYMEDGQIKWQAPKGKWLVCMTKISQNCGAHPSYINMTVPESCRVLIDAVYEPHWEHYKDDFGKTIAGFFSDEPELGNSEPYAHDPLGTKQDLPWSEEISTGLQERLGENWADFLPCLWENGLDAKETARVRYIYMDVVTKAVRKAFSNQVGNWCREHGVEYIGHLVEDMNGHARTGSGLGHYFRGLWGQDMAGIDDIGGQVMPQGEDGPDKYMMIMSRDGEFSHYTLGRLAPSLAAFDEKKHGRAMCEIFGNYGWAEGLRLERYLADHFMVNGINVFVPHAFSPLPYPDPDCPPHFYAHGHNPQYRHFRYLMEYMNRICELISGGRHISPIGVLYHAESEWTGKMMLDQKVLRQLLDNQINADLVPVDAFAERESYHTDLTESFKINTQEYKALVIPYTQFIGTDLLKAVKELLTAKVPVVFIDALPEGLYDDGAANLAEELKGCEIVSLKELASWITDKGLSEIALSEANDRIRYLHYQKDSEDLYYFINEGTECYSGEILIPENGCVYGYNAWDNQIEKVTARAKEHRTEVSISLEPLQSLLLVFGELPEGVSEADLKAPLNSLTVPENRICTLSDGWTRRVCTSIEYPKFHDVKDISLPDNLAKEMPKFSGWAQYATDVTLTAGKTTVLEVTEAYEGVELFVNGVSAGVQVTPVYRFDISNLVREGYNRIEIRVSTTLERERASARNRGAVELMQSSKTKSPTGITGNVSIYQVD